MKKIILTTVLSVLVNTLFSQNGFPTKQECEKFIQSNSKLHQEVEDKLGTDWSKLTVQSDGWKGYKGTVFSLSLTDCGRNLRNQGKAWPDDAAYAKWIVTTPKNKDGIYRQLGIYMDYKRTSYDGEYCKLGDWSFAGYRLEGGEEYGHKEFTKQEIRDVFFKEFKAGKIAALNNFIEIDELDGDDHFNQNVPQPGKRYMYVYFSGTEVNAASDNSVIYCAKEGSHTLTLNVEKSGNEWVVTNSSVDGRDPSEDPIPLGQYCYMNPDEPVENYETYATGGWEAIYMKKTERSTDGKYGDLMKRMKALTTLLKEKGTDIQKEDLIPFVDPSKLSEIDDPTTTINAGGRNFKLPFNTGKGEMSLKLEEVEYGGAVFVDLEIEGEMVEFALPNIKAKFLWLVKKGKKWESALNYARRSSSSKLSANHFQAWVRKNDQWYLYDVQAAYVASQECYEKLNSILDDM